MLIIYFAGSIRGGRDSAASCRALIAHTATRSRVLTEHVGDSLLSAGGENNLTDMEIYTRDMNWISSCEALIAEVSTPSLGVGYEIGMAEASNIPVLCLFNVNADVQLSAMISGNPKINLKCYKCLADAEAAIDEFISGLSVQKIPA